jgi:hypothetical protein
MTRLVAVQAGGYLVLLALIYEWFGIADRNAWQLVLSLLLGLVIVSGAVWLIASAVAAEFVALRRVRTSLIWIVVAALVVALCVWLAGYRSNVGLSVASHLTQWFRKPVKPDTMGAVYAWLLRIVATLGVLAVLPRFVKARPSRRYWITSVLLALAAWLLPALLIGWVPKLESFGAQTASMIVRFALAYAIALAAWLAIGTAARRSAATA